MKALIVELSKQTDCTGYDEENQVSLNCHYLIPLLQPNVVAL